MGTLEEYQAFAERHPEMFVNPPEGGFAIVREADEIGRAESAMATWLQEQAMLAEWPRVGIVFQDPFLLLLRDAVRFPDQSLRTYIRSSSQWHCGPGTAMLPHYKDQIVLLRHFRHATRRFHLEIPRGFGTPGLSTEQNAQKELQEEIGATTARVIPLGIVYPDTGMTFDVVELFYAEIASYTGMKELQGIASLVPLTVEELEQLIREGTITDPFTITAYTRARLQGLL